VVAGERGEVADIGRGVGNGPRLKGQEISDRSAPEALLQRFDVGIEREGGMVADAVAIISSVDPIMGEVDR